jgi:hypothetical protein
VLAAALEEVQGRAARLEDELTHLTGQQNLNQRIQYHKKVRCGSEGGTGCPAGMIGARHACMPAALYLPPTGWPSPTDWLSE